LNEEYIKDSQPEIIVAEKSVYARNFSNRPPWDRSDAGLILKVSVIDQLQEIKEQLSAELQGLDVECTSEDADVSLNYQR
jgi:hypothetical protein